MQNIPCNSLLLARDASFFYLKKKLTFFAQRLPKSVCKSRQILISRQKSICQGLKLSSESKLFGEGPSCLRTTSATLNRCSLSNLISKAASLKILLTPPSKSISETKDDLPLSLVDLRSRKNLMYGQKECGSSTIVISPKL